MESGEKDRVSLVTAFQEVEGSSQVFAVDNVMAHAWDIKQPRLEAIPLESAVEDIQYVAAAKVVRTGDENETNFPCPAHIRIGGLKESVRLSRRIELRRRIDDGHRFVKIGTAILQSPTKDVRLVETEQA